MSLFNHKCQECHKGTVKEEIKENYTVKLFNEDFVVEEARIGICDNCGAKNYAGEEIERWKKLYQKKKASSEKYLGHNQIKEIREYLNLTQQKFADFIGVSRQSISVWEQKDRPSAQPKNIDKILKMLYQEINSTDKPVIRKMIEQYNKEHEDNIKTLESKSRNEKFKSILPETTRKILKKQAHKNESTEIMEAVRIIETYIFSKNTQKSYWQNKKSNINIEEYTVRENSSEITYKGN